MNLVLKDAEVFDILLGYEILYLWNAFLTL